MTLNCQGTAYIRQ